jgi:hypothetical protein
MVINPVFSLLSVCRCVRLKDRVQPPVKLPSFLEIVGYGGLEVFEVYILAGS